MLTLCPPGILPNGYNPPDGFCWDQLCDDPPIRDDPDLEDYNVDDVVERFISIAKNQVRVPPLLQQEGQQKGTSTGR